MLGSRYMSCSYQRGSCCSRMLHPLLAFLWGGFSTACCLFSSIFQPPPMANCFPGNLSLGDLTAYIWNFALCCGYSRRQLECDPMGRQVWKVERQDKARGGESVDEHQEEDSMNTKPGKVVRIPGRELEQGESNTGAGSQLVQSRIAILPSLELYRFRTGNPTFALSVKEINIFTRYKHWTFYRISVTQ